MRFLRRFFVNLLFRVTEALRGDEHFQTFLPQDFMRKVLTERPNKLWVEVVGSSMITTFSYFDPTGNGTIHSANWYEADGVMPAIYRALLYEGAKNNGEIKDPFAILLANQWALMDYLGGDPLKAELDRLRRQRDDQAVGEA